MVLHQNQLKCMISHLASAFTKENISSSQKYHWTVVQSEMCPMHTVVAGRIGNHVGKAISGEEGTAKYVA
jgi:hypothetical protein